jgi:hypothetical protein
VIVVGLLGALSTNSLYAALPGSGIGRLADAILVPAFAAAYKLLLLVLLHFGCSGVSTLGPKATVLAVLFGVVYAVVNIIPALGVAPQRSEIVRTAADIAYAILAIPSCCRAMRRWASSAARALFVGGATVLVSAGTACARVVLLVFGTAENALVWEVMLHAVHAGSAALIIFLLHTTSGPEYQNLDGGRSNEPGIGLERASASADGGFDRN